MINYDPFWELMKERKISQYDLEHEYGLNHKQLDRLRNNKPITTTTLDKLCCLFDAKVEDLIEYRK